MYVLFDGNHEIMAVSEKKLDGFIYTEDAVARGFDGKLYFERSMPDFSKEKSVSEIRSKLEKLDSAITSRTLREAALGDEVALMRIKDVEEQAEELRQQLAELDNE